MSFFHSIAFCLSFIDRAADILSYCLTHIFETKIMPDKINKQTQFLELSLGM